MKEALLGKDNPINASLKVIIAHEYARLNELDPEYPIGSISQARFMELYIEALSWAKSHD